MRLTCLVDNVVAMAAPLWGEHGLSFLVETKGKKILFDTGQSGTVLLHNLERLKMKPKELSAIVLSHGHYDHTGGLADLLKMAAGLPIYGHPAVLEERFVTRKKKKPVSVGIPLSAKKLSKMANLRLSELPTEIAPGLWTTGSIAKRPELEGRGAKHMVRRKGDYIPDPYLDDLSLVWKGQDGLVVILGCAHAGILNILAHVSTMFPQPIKAVVGGTHLAEVDEAGLNHVIGVLRERYPHVDLYPNHCTGSKGFLALAQAFGTAVHACPADSVLEF